MTPPCVPAPTNQHRVRISSSANHHLRLRFKELHSRTFSLFKLSCDLTNMSDYDFDNLICSTTYFVVDSRPPPSSANRRSARLAACRSNPSPTSLLRESGISLDLDLEPSHLAQLASYCLTTSTSASLAAQTLFS
ncbi:hypothetical protein AMECASPLE_020665 [Ameca splendens]|uniref:Uncharacterized protein n=1 Tax=Ameca splendens TaxID=208324 RepID=A0ABV0YRN3_9TELE